jgi:predicted RND superfamily exporter protein
VLAPLSLAAVATVAIAVLADIQFNFANVVVLPLLLGIGVDSGIHLVHRHRVALEEGTAGVPERELLETSTAQAVFFSALTTMVSFGSLALSRHVGFASMGQLLLIGVVVMLVANLVVLPAILAVRGPEAKAPAGSQPAPDARRPR